MKKLLTIIMTVALIQLSIGNNCKAQESNEYLTLWYYPSYGSMTIYYGNGKVEEIQTDKKKDFGDLMTTQINLLSNQGWKLDQFNVDNQQGGPIYIYIFQRKKQ